MVRTEGERIMIKIDGLKIARNDKSKLVTITFQDGSWTGSTGGEVTNLLLYKILVQLIRAQPADVVKRGRKPKLVVK